SQAVTEEEVRVVVSRSRVGAARHLGGPGSVKGDYAAANVRLIIVVKGLLQLHTKGKGVPAVNLGELWGDIPLRIPVLDGALPLAARDERIAEAEARGHRCALAGGNNGIVGCRPAFLGHVEALIGRLPQVVVPAETGVDAARKCRAESVGPTHSNAPARGVFRAAVFTKPSFVRVLGQAEFLEVGEPAKQVLAGGEVLVHTGDVLVDVSAGAR